MVVKEAIRTGFGKMLVTHGAGMALYTNPAGCSAACQSIWPPLLMPAGATTPTGAPCLATAKLGTKLQVTYHKLRLYTFTNDTGHSVNRQRGGRLPRGEGDHGLRSRALILAAAGSGGQPPGPARGSGAAAGLTESGARTWSGRGDHGAAVAPPVVIP